MLKWLKSLFSAPQPAGPPQVLRAFAPDTPTITQSGIRAEQVPGGLMPPRSRRYDSLRWKVPQWSSVC